MKYRWKKQDRAWRKRSVRAAARNAGAYRERERRMRKWLMAVLAAEAMVLGAGIWCRSGAEFSFIRQQEWYRAEWAVPESVREKSIGPWDIYGIRFDRSRLELQFYHQTREVPQS